MASTTPTRSIGDGKGRKTSRNRALPTLIAAAETIACKDEQAYRGRKFIGVKGAARVVSGLTRGDGKRHVSSAKDAADKAIKTAAIPNAKGACMPAQAAAAPIST